MIPAAKDVSDEDLGTRTHLIRLECVPDSRDGGMVECGARLRQLLPGKAPMAELCAGLVDWHCRSGCRDHECMMKLVKSCESRVNKPKQAASLTRKRSCVNNIVQTQLLGSLLFLIFLPQRNPFDYPCDVRIQLLHRLGRELDDDVLRIRRARLLQDDLHDLSLVVLLDLFEGIVSAAGDVRRRADVRGKVHTVSPAYPTIGYGCRSERRPDLPIAQETLRMYANPRLGRRRRPSARVRPAAATVSRVIHHAGPTHSVLIDGIALPLLVVLLVEAALFDELAHVDVRERDGRLVDEQCCMGGLACARGTSDNDNRCFWHEENEGVLHKQSRW